MKKERKLRVAVQKLLAVIQKDIYRRLRKGARETPSGLRVNAKAPQDRPWETLGWDPAFWERHKELGEKILGEQAGELLEEGVRQASQLGLAVDFELANQQVLDYVGTYKSEWWNRLQSTTQNGLRRAIRTNIETGAPLKSLERSLEPLFGKTRAQVIASTETTRMFAEGNKIGYKSAGVEEVEFQTVRDSAVDPDCDALHGKRFPIDNPEISPPIHPRCRCWLAPVTGDQEVLRESAGEQFTETMSSRDMDDYAARNFVSAKEGYTRPELRYLRGFKEGNSDPINSHLRAGTTGEFGKDIASIDKAIAKQALKENTVAWRGIGKNVVNFQELEIGQGISDSAFVSTTLDRKIASGFGDTLLKLRLPKGTRAAFLDDAAIGEAVGIEWEAELLLSRGTTFRVLEKWVEEAGVRLAADAPLTKGRVGVILAEVV